MMVNYAPQYFTPVLSVKLQPSSMSHLTASQIYYISSRAANSISQNAADVECIQKLHWQKEPSPFKFFLFKRLQWKDYYSSQKIRQQYILNSWSQRFLKHYYQGLGLSKGGNKFNAVGFSKANGKIPALTSPGFKKLI